MVASGVALVVWVAMRRSRYFGNTVPLVMMLLLMPLMTTQTVTAPWVVGVAVSVYFYRRECSRMCWRLEADGRCLWR